MDVHKCVAIYCFYFRFRSFSGALYYNKTCSVPDEEEDEEEEKDEEANVETQRRKDGGPEEAASERRREQVEEDAIEVSPQEEAGSQKS